MMGGPMSVNDALPWIAPLAALLRDAVAADVPVIGHCLGGQLLAQALGAPVTRAPVAGNRLDRRRRVRRCARGASGSAAARAFTTFQWHYDAFALPAGATRVLTNAFNANQAYVVGDRHIGFQCHVEMTRALVETWLATRRDRAARVVVAGAAECRRHPPRPRRARRRAPRRRRRRLRALGAGPRAR